MPTPDPKPVLSPATAAILALIQGLLPAMTAIVGGLWVAFTYLENQKEAEAERQLQIKRENVARLLEARKPFIAKQLDLYVKTAQVAGELVASNSDTVQREKWLNTFGTFEQLYWTELSMVEDDTVKSAMQDLYQRLLWARQQPDVIPSDKWKDVQESAYRLARALRSSIEASWNLNP
jgi:hypothetical protein